ncbi:uncharacterized protein LOC126974784 isoform X2 [Leptidea sinapis]|uniref:uncharacterized protein LOC126974784 isoform X2 n=1 Tax=Leptidea sinapis TaxID=189913 RepID=UPI0021C3E5D5|nr:uncharacterized protein LOC126974784 isoform X2 [Leptidea sinapis]
MVNNCCVTGCKRNSKLHKNLNFYSLPRDKKRQEQWLIAAGKQDLLKCDSEKLKKHLRFCSRHFKPSAIVFKHLKSNAVPSEKLAGSFDESDNVTTVHDGVICDVCKGTIEGFRYKCVTCDNFDLCQKCEMLQSHSQHCMFRIPHKLKFKLADELLEKWQELLAKSNITSDTLECKMEDMSSDDDEPITKYITNYTPENLSDDVKKDIQKEVLKAMKSVKKNKLKSKEAKEVEFMNVPEVEDSNSVKDSDSVQVPELAFADVSSMKQITQNDEVKLESLPLVCMANTADDNTAHLQPVLYLKINDVLTTLVIGASSDMMSQGPIGEISHTADPELISHTATADNISHVNAEISNTFGG